MSQPRDYQIAVYYFPNYHADPRNELSHGRGWTEWELVKLARPRFPGHRQPKVPVWGYQDESNPRVFAGKIDAAAAAGIDCFLFDWYAYEDGLFLQGALERGYLGAANTARVKFALMWANHDWLDIHPASPGKAPRLLYPGTVGSKTFAKLVGYWIENYLGRPSYWKLGGKLYLSVYELHTFVRGLGGPAGAQEAIGYLRDKVRAAGLGEMHLNAIDWGVRVPPGDADIASPNALLAKLGIDSVGSYTWLHQARPSGFPTSEYREAAEQARDYWYAARRDFQAPYLPNVTIGWDTSPRAVQSGEYSNAGYPFGPILVNNTPQLFARSLRELRQFLDEGTAPKVLTINAWNEWTEGSCLEPDTQYRTGHLDAIQQVFPR